MIHHSWKPLFEKHTLLLSSIEETIQKSTKNIYPSQENRFRVFEKSVDSIQIVILGQDPYHQPHQAHGLSFSVPKNMKIPPSLVNIFKEIKSNFPERNYTFHNGDLSRWYYEEHIFLLNASLSVEEGNPGCHMKLWSAFTNDVISFISENNKNAIFLLFGNFAINKSEFINDKNRILTTSHPSPLGAYKGFIGSNIFKKCELLLQKEINWNI